MADVRLVPYRLPELLAADPSDVVIVAEGEKDVDRLRAEGYVATCNVGGAGKWRDAYSPHLAGRHVVIVPDADRAGRDHAAQVARSVAPVAASVKVVELPNLPPKGDVSDWLDAGGTAAELRAIIEAAAVWVATPNGPGDGDGDGGTTVCAGAPEKFRLTDVGNAERFHAQHGRDARYNHVWGKWLDWEGRRWQIDNTAAVRRRAKQTVRSIASEAGAPEISKDGTERVKLTPWRPI